VASVPGGYTLTVSTTAGVATYQGLTLKKQGASYELIETGVSQARAFARGASVAKPHPLLVEQELTAATGKHKHVIGVELEFSKSLDASLAHDIAKRFTNQAARPLGVQFIADVAGSNQGLGLVASARIAPGGREIVVVAKPS